MKTLQQDADALAIYLTHLSSHEIQLQIYDYVEVSHALESRYFYHLFGAGGFHLFYCDKLNKKRKKNTPKHPSLNFTWPKVHKCITCLKEPTNKRPNSCEKGEINSRRNLGVSATCCKRHTPRSLFTPRRTYGE